MMFRKYKGVDSRIGGTDRRYVGRWAKHIWGIILLFAFLSGGVGGYNLRADGNSVAEALEEATEGDIVRSQVILDSLISYSMREPEVLERVIVRDVLVHDTLRLIDTVLVTLPPQIVRVRDTIEVLIIDTVFAPPQIITIPAPSHGYFSSHYFEPRAGNILYLLGGVALGHLLGSDATACVIVSTDGTVRENCDPKR